MKRFASFIVAAAVVGAGAVFLLTAGLATASGASASSALPTLTIALDGNSVTVGGAMQSGAVNVVSTVTKETAGEPTLIRLNPGVPFSAFVQAGAAISAHHGDFNYLNAYGAIVFDAAAKEGTSSVQTVLAPGNYFALDTVGMGNPPHASFTVSQAAQPASLPAPGATVSSIEFGFHAPGTLHDGELVRFENDGFLVHMIQAIGVRDAKAAKQLTALLLAGKDKQAQRFATSLPMFAGPLSSGGWQQLVVNERPGVYVLACFMNTQDGREHTQLGMERTIRIVK
jgi:hypothetical protein